MQRRNGHSPYVIQVLSAAVHCPEGQTDLALMRIAWVVEDRRTKKPICYGHTDYSPDSLGFAGQKRTLRAKIAPSSVAAMLQQVNKVTSEEAYELRDRLTAAVTFQQDEDSSEGRTGGYASYN